MKLFLVGNKRSTKTNQWLAVTPYEDEAQRLQEEIPGATCIKTVTPRKRKAR